MVSYRRDIDGLRAVAVLPVVMFHAGIPGFSGGYVGVDIFFVISGYLITAILVDEASAGQFSIARFYERRVRRIFPALFFMLFAVLAAAATVFLADDFADLGRAAAATSLFGSNFYFWQQAGYFEASSEMRPLLHTWSLAVEEQFYIVLPLALLAIYRWGRGKTALWLGMAWVVSLAISEWGLRNTSTSAYYLAPSRAWELLCGSLLAVRVFPALASGWQRELAAAAGLLMIVWSVVVYTDATPFPGVYALLPCLGAMLLLHVAEGTQVGRLLSLPLMVGVGLISYSLYLWHWPLLTFAKYLWVHPLPSWLVAIVVALSFFAGWMSWRFVEKPFRIRALGRDRRELFFLASGAMALAVAVGVFLHLQAGVPSRVPAAVATLDAARHSYPPRHMTCLARGSFWLAPEKACVRGASDQQPEWALLGDSHASAMFEAFGDIAARHGKSVILYAYAGCPPALDIVRLGEGSRCHDYVRAAIEDIERRNIREVIVVSRYAVAMEGFTRALGPAEKGLKFVGLSSPDGSVDTDAERREYFRKQFIGTMERLTAAGRHIVLVYPVPETGYDIPSTLARLQWFWHDSGAFVRPSAFFYDRNRYAMQVLDEAAQLPGIDRVYPHKLFCTDDTCRTTDPGLPLYRDDDHVSLHGAQLIVGEIEPLLLAQ